MNDDAQLLIRFANKGDEAAFSELVNRHVNLVYSVALRLLGGDTHLAQDVTQTVFTDLARKAKALPRDTVLSGWFHAATRFAAANAVRTERRRQAREQEATVMHDPASESTPDWDQLRPVLDTAIGELSTIDRDAVLLRFFERKDFNAVGAALGVSEDAAQKRVARALDKLRTLLTQRGVNLPAAALAAAISGGAVQTAPAGIGAIVATTALASAATAATVTQATITTMNWLNAKAVPAIIAAAIVAGTGTYFVQQREIDRLRAEQRNLLAEQETLRADQTAASTAAQRREKELERLQKDVGEVVRLRGEVAGLRRLTQQSLQRGAPTPRQAPPRTAQESADFSAGTISFSSAHLGQVLPIYAELTGAELDVDPQVQVLAAKISYTNSETMTRTKAIAVIEQVLAEQAGLVIQRGADGRTTVRRSVNPIPLPAR